MKTEIVPAWCSHEVVARGQNVSIAGVPAENIAGGWIADGRDRGRLVPGSSTGLFTGDRFGVRLSGWNCGQRGLLAGD